MTTSTTCHTGDHDLSKVPLLVSSGDLLKLGICKVPLPGAVSKEQWQFWANSLSQPTPEILSSEGDGEYAFYRNILEEPEFPFDLILDSDVGKSLLRYFGLKSLDEVQLNDAFCIHYNSDQQDTSGGRHIDPSDITVNLCLDKSDDTEGSHVLFYGTKRLEGVEGVEPDIGQIFLVSQEVGCATIHWGDHPHRTTPLEKGKRTNIVLTYWFTDKTRSMASSRTCYS